MEDSLSSALALREQGEVNEAHDMLMRLVAINSDNPILNYHCACSCDALGLEREAVPYYVRSLELGLPEEEMQGAYLGLGSTYRALGMYEDSHDVLRQGSERFPDNKALTVFLAMTLYNLRLYDKAMEHTLVALAETSTDHRIQRYRRAIEFYAQRLDEKW